MRAGIVLSLVAGAGALAQGGNEPLNPRGSTRVILANSFAPSAGGGVETDLVNQEGRTVEWVFSGSQISMFAPGTRIVSAGFRNATTSAAPPDQYDFSDWSLTMSRSLAAPGMLSSTISENGAPDATMVRSGALTLLPGSIERKPSANATAPFSFIAQFDDGLAYSGGHLRFVMTHDAPAIGGAGMRAVGASLDAASPGSPDRNVLFEARRALTANATLTTESTNAPVTRLGVDAAIALPLLTATASNGRAGFVGALGPADFASQFVIGAEQLRFVPRGSLITWLTFRLAPGEIAWPGADVMTSDFEIEVATSTSLPQSMGTFFGSNADSDAIVVRDGALTIPAGGFGPLQEGATSFGLAIHFQRGFVYKGGGLCITVRHSAFVGGAGPKLDTASASGGGALRTVVSASKSATGGTFLPADDAIAMQVGYTPSLSVPQAFETESGGSGAWVFETPRVHQLVIDPSQLGNLPPGSTVDGIVFRISPVDPGAFVSWPHGDANVTQFDVTLSTAQRTAIQMSTTFAVNEGADKVLVRSGSLFVPSEAMKVVGNDVGEQSFVIPFSKPFVYTGGGLCVTMRIGQRLGGGAAVNFDGKFNTAGVNGKRATASSTETTGNNAIALATRLVFTRPAPTCPADLNADGVVDDLDFVVFVEAYEFLTTPAADFDFDGVTADSDFSVFAVAYDALVCP